MKQNLYDIFDDLTPEETAGLLEGIEAEDAGDLDMDRITADVLAQTRIKKKAARPVWRRPAAIAASLLLVLGAGFGLRAYAAEQKEYDEAVEFFAVNSLSTEGLSRAEIKAVYRDITTGIFSYEKTAEVIEKGLSVEGYEIFQEEPTPEEVAALWNHRVYNSTYNYSTGYWAETVPEDRVSYRFDGFYEGDPADGNFLVTVKKFVGETPTWTVTIPEYWGEAIQPVTGGVIVYGYTPIEKHVGDAIVRSKTYSWLAKISEDGTLLWHWQLPGGLKDEEVGAVVEDPDGSYAVFSRGDRNTLCLYRYSAEGELISVKSTDLGGFYLHDAVRLGDGYLLRLDISQPRTVEIQDIDVAGNPTGTETVTIYEGHPRLVKADADGNLTDSFSYEGEDSTYHITDMMEFGGKVYLSAYAVPKQEHSGLHYELEPVYEIIFDKENPRWEISSEELTPMVRDNYTALLLVCAPKGGEPQEFYSVKGSLGGKLTLSEDGNLLWNVESVTSTYFSPATSSFTIGGTSTVYRYTFNPAGALIRQEKTEEMAPFHR